MRAGASRIPRNNWPHHNFEKARNIGTIASGRCLLPYLLWRNAMSRLGLLGATALSLTLAVATPALAQQVHGNAGVRSGGIGNAPRISGVGGAAAFRGAQANTNFAGRGNQQFVGGRGGQQFAAGRTGPQFTQGQVAQGQFAQNRTGNSTAVNSVTAIATGVLAAGPGSLRDWRWVVRLATAPMPTPIITATTMRIPMATMRVTTQDIRSIRAS